MPEPASPVRGQIDAWARRPTLVAIVVCAAFFLAIYLGLSLPEDFTTHGDIETDQRAVIGAREFLKVGFRDLAFTQIEDSGPEIGASGWYYHRHPSGGVVLLALAVKAGFTLQQARAIPLLFTTLGLFGLFLFFREATGRPWLAVAGTAFYASLAPVWLLADSYQFYSYAMFVKGIAYWQIAAGVRRSGAARRMHFALLSAVLVLAVTVFGLETIPAVGVLAVCFPLFFAEGDRRHRIRCALAAGSWAAAGIGVGLFLHILNVLAIPGTTFRGVVEGYFLSLHTRSLQESAFVALEHPYPVEVLRRFALYMPQIVAAAGSAVLWVLARLVTRRAVRVPEWRLLLATLVAEGLYFVFMQGHVRAHVHTMLHLSVFAATVGMISLAVLRDGFDWSIVETVLAALLGGAIVLAALLAPLEGWGSLRPPGAKDDGFADDVQSLGEFLGSVPRNSVIVVVGDAWEQFRLGYILARMDLPMIGAMRGPAVLELAAKSERPSFAIASDYGPADMRRTLRKLAPVIGESGRLTLFGLSNFNHSMVSKRGTAIGEQVIAGARLISPGEGELKRATVNYRVFGAAGKGVWMIALGKPVTSPTVVRIDLPEEERPERAREVSASFQYARRVEFRQPVLTASVRAFGGGAGDSRPAGEAVIASLLPGKTAECRVVLPASGPLHGVEIEVRLAPGQSETAGAVVEVEAIRYLSR